MAGIYAASAISSMAAAPVPGQITPVAIYTDTQSAFGLAYDIRNNLMWFSQGDSGDNAAHSFKPYKDYTAAEILAMPLLGGLRQLTPATGNLDVAGTTSVAGSGGSGSGVHFSELAYDAATGQLVANSGGPLKSFDPFTGLNLNSNYKPFPNHSGFADGLDVDSGDVWFSPDVGPIYKNGVLFASGMNGAAGYSGVERVGDSVFAVAVGSFGGHERTIFKFDLAGNLVGFDPDGDPTAVRWEGLAFDGTYLYAADLRGNANGSGVAGDIYVFAATGGIEIPPQNPPPPQDPNPPAVPEVGSMASAGVFASLAGFAWLRRRKQA